MKCYLEYLSSSSYKNQKKKNIRKIRELSKVILTSIRNCLVSIIFPFLFLFLSYGGHEMNSDLIS